MHTPITEGPHSTPYLRLTPRHPLRRSLAPAAHSRSLLREVPCHLTEATLSARQALPVYCPAFMLFPLPIRPGGLKARPVIARAEASPTSEGPGQTKPRRKPCKGDTLNPNHDKSPPLFSPNTRVQPQRGCPAHTNPRSRSDLMKVAVRFQPTDPRNRGDFRRGATTDIRSIQPSLHRTQSRSLAP
jgi:hypothetical protein